MKLFSRRKKIEPVVRSPEELLLDTLTTKERAVFDLLVVGMKMKEIATELNRSSATINTHINSIYSKLGVNSKAKLILRYGKINEGR